MLAAALIFAAALGPAAHATPNAGADMHTLMSRALFARQTDYSSYLPDACKDRCTTFTTIYPQCRADPVGEGCMAVCQADAWEKFSDCLTCVEQNSGSSFSSSLSGIAERCVEQKGINPMGEGNSTAASGSPAASGSSAASGSAAASSSPAASASHAHSSSGASQAHSSASGSAAAAASSAASTAGNSGAFVNDPAGLGAVALGLVAGAAALL